MGCVPPEPDGLRGVRSEDEVDGLAAERVEQLPGRFAEPAHQAPDRLVDIGLRHSTTYAQRRLSRGRHHERVGGGRLVVVYVCVPLV